MNTANQENANKFYNLGHAFQHGIGVAKDELMAFKYYQNAAILGHDLGTFQVGHCYHHGIGVNKDDYKAFEYYQKSADMGNMMGIFQIGLCYYYGIGTVKDDHKYFTYNFIASNLGHSAGTHNVRYCYLYGIGVEKDEHKAFFYFQKSAEMGYAEGIHMVGICYEYGIGVERNEHKAFFYFQKSAEMGNTNAINEIGYCYHYGIGVEKDAHKAFFYYQKSAEMGNARGVYNVGDFYYNGISVKKDDRKAFEYYQKAANMGDVGGISFVALCYRNGIGVERDIQKANYWFRRTKDLMKVAYDYAYERSEIDDDLKNMLIENKYQLPWIPCNEINIIKKIGKGGFATVYYARWFDKSTNLNREVALKILELNDRSEFIKELKIFCNIRDIYPSFLKCYGMTKYEGRYVLILEYAAKNSLCKNLIEVARMDWIKKLNLLQCITYDLDMIHFQGYIHRDLHSGNILQREIYSAYVADLGLSLSTKSNVGIYGVLPYIAPEVLQKKSFTQSADIYSFGIIMAEITTGQRPFDGNKFDMELAIRICNGLRPEFAHGTPDCYIELAKQCMDPDTQKRPTASHISDKLGKWINCIIFPSIIQDNEVELIKRHFLEADKIVKELPIFTQKHSDLMYTSKLINTHEITEQLSKLADSRSFNSVEIP